MTSDRERFEVCFRAHYGAVLAYARRRAGASGAQDAVAETFLVAWRRWDESPKVVLPWLYGIAWGVLANQRRGDERQRALTQRLAREPAVADPLPAFLDARLDDAVRGLPDRERELLLLVAWEGLTPGQAGVAVGCGPAAARARLHRARRRLRRELADHLDLAQETACAPTTF